MTFSCIYVLCIRNSADPNDLKTLTPSHFLIEIVSVTLLDPDLQDILCQHCQDFNIFKKLIKIFENGGFWNI